MVLFRKKQNKTTATSSNGAAFVFAAPIPPPIISNSNSNSNKRMAKLIHQRSSVLFACMFCLACALALLSILSGHPYDEYSNHHHHHHHHHHHQQQQQQQQQQQHTRSVPVHSEQEQLQSKLQTERKQSMPRQRPKETAESISTDIAVAFAAVDVKRKRSDSRKEPTVVLSPSQHQLSSSSSSSSSPSSSSSLSDSAIRMKSNKQAAIILFQQQQQQQQPGLLMTPQNPILRLFYYAGVMSNISIADYKALPDVWRNWKQLYYYNDDDHDHDHVHADGETDTNTSTNSSSSSSSSSNNNNNNKNQQTIKNNDEYDPIILGMETCREYRQRVPLEQRYSGPAGLFNTGTNALEFALKHNIEINNNNNYNNNNTAHHHHRVLVVWQVPWGKHRLVEKARLRYVAPGMHIFKPENCLPIVIIRDPYHWLQSMCKMPYSVYWRHDANRCPNLVPTLDDRVRFKDISMMPPPPSLIHSIHNNNNNNTATTNSTPNTFSVKVVFEKRTVEYFDSLVDLWSEWYRPYFLQATTNSLSSSSSSSLSNSSYPVLMIRHEDLLLHGPKVVKAIAQCMGIKDIKSQRHRRYRYQTDPAKSHGSGTNLVKAILQAGDVTRRNRGGGGGGNDMENGNNSNNVTMTRDDLLYAYSHLNHEMMKAFHYKFIMPPS